MSAKKRQIDDLLAVALAEGCTIKDSATRCGVSVRTVERRLSEDDGSIRRRVTELRTQTADAISGRLQRAGLAAVECLETLLDDELSTVRVTAARAILSNMTKIRELAEIETRLAQLEEAVAKAIANGQIRGSVNGSPTFMGAKR